MSFWFNCLAGFGRTVESKIALSLVQDFEKIALSLVQKMIKTALKLVQFFLFLGEEVVQDDAF